MFADRNTKYIYKRQSKMAVERERKDITRNTIEYTLVLS